MAREEGEQEVNSLFIHIPKTGGMSVIHNLDLDRVGSLISVRHCPVVNGRGHVSLGHLPYRLLVKYGCIDKKFQENSFKYAFCRNPFDRAISHWAYTRNAHPELLSRGTSFLEFTKTLMLEKRWRPQSTWLSSVRLDYLGRFESFEESLKEVAGILEIKIGPIVHRNSSPHEDYRSYYCSESKRNVIKRYEEDFDMFRYSRVL